MKKIMIGFTCAALVLSMAVTAFAVEQDAPLIYATETEAADVAQAMEHTKAADTLDYFGIEADPDTMMPVYQASLFDFAESGNFEYEPLTRDGNQVYISDAVSNNGKFAGVIQFDADDIQIYKPSENRLESVDFKANMSRVSSLAADNAISSISDAKLMFADGLGYAYYIEDGEDAFLVAAGFKGANGDIFTEENGGIVAVDSALMVQAEELVQKKAENEAYLATLAPGENPETGAGMPAFVVDNAPYSTNHTSLWIMAAALTVILSAVGFLTVSKLKKGQE